VRNSVEGGSRRSGRWNLSAERFLSNERVSESSRSRQIVLTPNIAPSLIKKNHKAPPPMAIMNAIKARTPPVEEGAN
jgi:hypothetical protein